MAFEGMNLREIWEEISSPCKDTESMSECFDRRDALLDEASQRVNKGFCTFDMADEVYAIYEE